MKVITVFEVLDNGDGYKRNRRAVICFGGRGRCSIY